MFGTFEVLGVLLGAVEHTKRDGSKMFVGRVMTRWQQESTDKPVHYNIPVRFWNDHCMSRLAACRRGDLVICYGNIVIRKARNGNEYVELQCSNIERLIAGYWYHASGRCDPTKEHSGERNGNGAGPAGNAGNPAAGQPAPEVSARRDRG